MAQKGKAKLRDLGNNRNKQVKSKRVQRAAERGNVRFYNDLRLKEKAANERMRQLEKRGLNSPAYQSVQAQLEILGKRTKGNRGRRFSETGKATYNEAELLNKILDNFLYEQSTSTVKGAKEYQKDVWESGSGIWSIPFRKAWPPITVTGQPSTDAGISYWVAVPKYLPKTAVPPLVST